MQTAEINRAEFIGGSEIAAVVGVSKWRTPLEVWAEKTGKIQRSEVSEAAELGSELEDFVARKFMRTTGIKVRRAPKYYHHPKYDFLRCQVDRLVEGTDELLECKTCGAWVAKEWEGEEIPQEYVLQVQWQLGITERSKGYIAVLIGGQCFKHKEILFDKELFDSLVEKAVTFWNEFVMTDTPPKASAGDSPVLLQMFPSAAGDLVQIDDPEKCDDLDTAVERRLELKKEISAIEDELDALEAGLKQIVGDAPGVETRRYKVTWSPQSSRRADPEAMKKAGVFDLYSKVTNSRVLRVSARKEE